ncbi:unnamed protein product, partial [Rotaria sp. Silwood1]
MAHCIEDLADLQKSIFLLEEALVNYEKANGIYLQQDKP